MKSLARLAVGLIASLAFAGSVVTALVLAYTLTKEGIRSRGNIAEWGARLRHYTDTLSVKQDGSWRIYETSYPLLQMLGVFVAAVLLAVGAAWLVRISTFSSHRGQQDHV